MSSISGSVNPLAKDSVKDSPEYGLKLLKAATDRWNTGYGESRLSRANRFNYNRSYHLGKYDMNEFKDILDLDGEFSVVNLPYDPLPIALPFLNRLKDRYNQREEIIQCDGIDPYITGKKKAAKDNALFKVQNTQAIQAVQQQSGVQTEEFNPDDPTTESEVDIEFDFSYREREEIIMENLIKMGFYENGWSDVIKDRLLDDLIDCGYAGTKVYIDGTGRIKIRFIKPENLITSYSEWNDFRDWQYQGEIYYKSITEIRMQYPNKISEELLYNLSQNLVGKYGNPADKLGGWNTMWNTSIARPYDAWRVPVVELDFKTLYNLTSATMTDKYGKDIIVDDDFKIAGKSLKDMGITTAPISDNPYYVGYTGVYIMDTDYLLEWGLSKNMVKPEKNLQEIVSQYCVFMYNNTEMTNKPLMETIIPAIKEMQIYKLQMLKIVAAAAPDGYDVDVATMSDISLTGVEGDNMSPLELYSIYKQTGIKYYKSIPDEGLEGGQRRVPIQANNAPFSAKLQELSNLYNGALLTLTQLVSNELDAGNIRNQAVGDNVLQEAKKTGESTSNYIYNAFLNIMQRTAKVVQLRGWDILMYGKKFGIQYYDGYRQAIGSKRVEYFKLESTDEWAKTAFDVQIRTVIGDADNLFLEQNMQTALAKDSITLADAIDVREIARTNVRWASRVLAQRIDKRNKEKQEGAMQLAQQNTQAATAGAQVKNDGEMQLAQFQAKTKKDTDQQSQTNAIALEDSKFNSILKIEIAKAVLAKEGSGIADIPQFVFEGVPLERALDHAAIMSYLQTAGQAAQQNAQQMQAQAAETNAQNQQAQIDQQQPNAGVQNQEAIQ